MTPRALEKQGHSNLQIVLFSSVKRYDDRTLNYNIMGDWMNEFDDEDEVMYDGEPQSSQDVMFWDCEKIIKAGIWLIRNGYGRMAILPYAAPSGCYWRCEFHPIGQPKHSFFRYTTGSAGRFLQDHCGGSLRRTISPKGLAKAIMVSVPQDLKDRCTGDVSVQTERWLEDLERSLSQKLIPQAFEDYGDYSDWKLISIHGSNNSWLEPQPGYIKPGTEPTWQQQPFWRSCESQGESLRDCGSFTVDPNMLDQAVSSEIAIEVFRAMKDANEFESEQILRSAVKAVLFRLRAVR